MLNVVRQLCSTVELPKMIQIKQKFNPRHIEPSVIPAAIIAEMSKPSVVAAIKPNQRVAITCGSRGLANHALITKSI